MIYILGISCYYHDSAACLLKDGNLIAAVQEERFSRVKHDFSFPEHAIRFCLESANIKGENLDFVVFHEKPFVKLERIIKSMLATYPMSCKFFSETAVNWFKQKLWIKAVIAEFLNIKGDKILFSGHHLSHAASVFFCSPFKEAAILTVDGVGEWTTTTIGVGKADWGGMGKNEIRILEEIRFPHSLGLLYSVFTAFLGFKVNNGEYKVMGMSSFGEPVYTKEVYKLIRANSDGSFRLNMRYFSYQYSTKYSFNHNFIKLFGIPRKPESRFVLGKSHCAYDDRSVQEGEIQENRRFADIAASIQKVTEDILIKAANYLHDKTKLENLCLAGGVALNCVANYKILENTPFKRIFIQPAAGDSGGALGAALYTWHCLLNKPRKFIMRHAYWGKSYSNKEIKSFLIRERIAYKELDDDDLVDYVSEALTAQKIAGWFQGRFEWGPRALGNRSILADPRKIGMKDNINIKIKFREPFRPFAPSVLWEYAQEFFDIKNPDEYHPSKFMLYTVPVKNKEQIPAVVHVDGTSRIQAVSKKDNPLYYKLIDSFRQKTGIPLLLNTSFNLRGEPIVSRPEDAYNTFVKNSIDLLVLGNCIIERSKLF